MVEGREPRDARTADVATSATTSAPGAPDRPPDRTLPGAGRSGDPDPAPAGSGGPPAAGERARVPRWRALVVDGVLLATWTMLSALLCYLVAVDAHTARSTELLVASLLAALSALLVVSVVAVRRAADRSLRAAMRDASVALHSMERVTDPALSFLGLDDLLDSVLARTKEAVGGDLVAILLVEDDRRVLRVRAVQGAAELAPVGTELPLGEGIVGTAAEWARPVVVPDVSGTAGGALADRGLASLMAAPLLVDGATIGVVEVASKVRRDFDRADLRLLQVVADRVAASIQRARLDEARQRNRLGADHANLHLSVLARAGTVLAKAFDRYDEVLAELGDVVVPEFADWFVADMLDPAGELRRVAARWVSRGLTLGQSFVDVAHPHPRGDELVRLAIAERRPQVIMATTRIAGVDLGASVHLPHELGGPVPEVESMMVVPVRVQGVFTGALTFVTSPTRRAYRPSDLETARELADRVGVTVERVMSWRASRRAGEAAVRYAERLQKLAQAALVVNAQLAEEEVIELLAQHAQRVLGAAVVVISGISGARPLQERVWPPDWASPGAHPDGRRTGRHTGRSWPEEISATVLVAAEAVARSGRPSRRPDDAEATDHPDASPAGALRSGGAGAAPASSSWLAVPVTDARGDCTRVVVAVGADGGRFSAEDESVLMLLAQMASVALQNANLYAAVRANEHRLEAVVESSPLAIAELDLSGTARWWNRAAGELFGWGDDATPRTVAPRAGSELVLAGLWDRARSAKPAIGVAMPAAGPRGQLLELSVSTSPLMEQGAVSGVLLVAEDVTERQRMLAQFHQAERLGAMTRMAGAVAHDFNNLLTVILGCSEVLVRELGDDEHVGEDVAAIQRAGSRAAALTGQLVRIGQQGPVQPEVVDVDELIGSMEPVLARVLGDHATLELVRRAGSAKVFVDRNELERSVLNLAINARDAMPEGGRFTVRTGRAARHAGGERTVQLSFTDTGTGMDPDTVAQCFEPFFTTKGRARGTGLGLATVHAMVAGAGGEVRVDSAPGKGTRFTIWFPVHEPAAVPPGRAPAGTGDRSDVAARRTGHVVIVVDDEPEVLRLSVRELERAGYQVVGATEGSQALNALHARNGAADLLVTDVVMPGMNGIELAAAVTRRYPQIPVLFLSGHLDEEAEAARRSLPGDAELLTKPFTPDELSERVGRVIDRHAAPVRHRPRGGPSHARALPAPPAPPASSAAPEPATTPEPATPGAGRRRRSQGSKR